MLIAGIGEAAAQLNASSAHLTFLPRGQWENLGEAGFLQRIDQQFHWVNEGYADFEAFLDALASRKRKNIRKERRDALANGITIRRLIGAEITEAHWDAFFAFYMDTGSRKWGRPYLTRAFFSEVGRSMAERILLILAEREGRPIAGAINFLGEKVIYGRNWGCIEDHTPSCISRSATIRRSSTPSRMASTGRGRRAGRAQAGARLQAALTYSAHLIRHEGLRRAVASYLVEERRHVLGAQGLFGAATPFRRGNRPSEPGLVLDEALALARDE